MRNNKRPQKCSRERKKKREREREREEGQVTTDTAEENQTRPKATKEMQKEFKEIQLKESKINTQVNFEVDGRQS